MNTPNRGDIIYHKEYGYGIMKELPTFGNMQVTGITTECEIITDGVDLHFVKRILPEHFTIKQVKPGHILCFSIKGIERGGYFSKGIDDEHWGYIFQAFKQHFSDRLKEVFHNSNIDERRDFSIYFKPIIND